MINFNPKSGPTTLTDSTRAEFTNFIKPANESFLLNHQKIYHHGAANTNMSMHFTQICAQRSLTE